MQAIMNTASTVSAVSGLGLILLSCTLGSGIVPVLVFCAGFIGIAGAAIARA